MQSQAVFLFVHHVQLASEIYRVMGRHGVTGGGSVGIVQSAPALQRSDLGRERKEDTVAQLGELSST